MLNLLLLFLIPLFGSVALFFLSCLTERNLKRLAFTLSLLPLLYLIVGNTQWINATINYPWLPPLSIQFHLSIDSLSLLFLFLTAFIIPISIVAVSEKNLVYPNILFGLILLLESLLIGFFTARDLAVFTIFWEAMLLPLYFIINIWGGPRRQFASLQFLIYMIAGSALMIAAVLALYFDAAATLGTGSFDLDTLAKTASAVPHAAWLLAIFLLAFAVKTPLFPFHAWLPDAYYEAPASGTILLSALLSKAGIYGILRIAMELFPDLFKAWSPVLLALAVIGVFYGGMAAWMQKDYKRLIAYSSFSHVNFVLIGLFVWTEAAHTGAVLQALNHGITIAALFLTAWWLEERIGTTAIGIVSGAAKFLPYLCWVTLFFVLSNVALPGTNNFVGELLIFFGLFQEHPWLTAFLGLVVILTVLYMLRWMQKVYFETPAFCQRTWIDIGRREFAIVAPLVILIIWLGMYPAPILEQIAQVLNVTSKF